MPPRRQTQNNPANAPNRNPKPRAVKTTAATQVRQPLGSSPYQPHSISFMC